MRVARYRTLDGLRGLAALVVVFHHGLLTSRVLAGTYRGGSASGFDGLLARTPLHLFWDGTGAVLVFFVLSGFVLTLGFLPQSRPRWMSYYVKRLPRLYLPVWAALGFAVALAALVPRVVTASQSWWINAHAASTTVTMVGRDALLWANPSLLDSPLWSLRWEVAYSLLLPVYVAVAIHWRRLAWLKILGSLLLVGVGSKTGHASLLYLPVFALGSVLAVEQKRVAAGMARAGRYAWWVMAVLGGVALSANYTFGPYAQWVDRPLRSAGAALIVLLFLQWSRLNGLARNRTVQWLGSISFSLYLVHEPIVVSVDRLLPGDNPWEVLAVALPLALLAAAAFHRAIEVPSLAVSRWAGRIEARPTEFWASDRSAGRLGA